jgi:hypothetical protein
MDLIHTVYEDVDWVQLAQDWTQWHALADARSGAGDMRHTWKRPEGKNHLRDLGVNGRISLKWIL